jgi:2-amino-4-hydroxy-6-hydroxymethyldihydropteridine diphosphokinase
MPDAPHADDPHSDGPHSDDRFVDVYVALGSNDDPQRRLVAAVAALTGELGVLRPSSAYRTAAVGASAPDYLNMAVGFRSDAGPDAVKAVLVAIEAAAGRARTEPRTALVPLDLDLLVYGARVDAERRLPHPDVLRRPFVLAPLAEIAPDIAHPLTGETLASAWRSLQGADREITRLGALSLPRG